MSSNTEVLVIDDDPGVIFLHKIIIQESGLSKQPISFDEALEALDYIVPKISSKDQKFLIFLDINMPYMNGWDFLNKLSPLTNTEQVKVIMVTSSLSQSDRDKANTYDLVVDFMEKPLIDLQCRSVKSRLNGWMKDQ